MNGTWKKKENLLVQMGATLALLNLFVTACGSSASTNITTQENTKQGSSDNAGSTDDSGKILKIGESGVLFDLKLTVNSIQKPSEFDGQILKEGTQLIVVNVTAENVGKETTKFNPVDIELHSSQPSADFNVSTLTGPNVLQIKDLAPAEKVTGVIPFEHPINDPMMILTFKPNMMSDKVIKFDLK